METICLAEKTIDALLKIEQELEQDTSGNEYLRSAKFYTGTAILLIRRALKEMKGEY